MTNSHSLLVFIDLNQFSHSGDAGFGFVPNQGQGKPNLFIQSVLILVKGRHLLSCSLIDPRDILF